MRLQDVATPQLTTRLLTQAKKRGLTGSQVEQYIKQGVLLTYQRLRRHSQVPDTLLGCCNQLHTVTAFPFTTPCCGRVFQVTKGTP